MNRLHHWIIEHDDRWSFLLLYVGGAIVLSIFLNLFWVSVLMAAHLALEIVRHYIMRSRWPLLQALWCVKLDISLILFSLVIAVYADTIFAMLGIGQAARATAGARAVARFGVIERSLKVFFLTIDDFGRVGHVLYNRLRTPTPRRTAVMAMAAPGEGMTNGSMTGNRRADHGRTDSGKADHVTRGNDRTSGAATAVAATGAMAVVPPDTDTDMNADMDTAFRAPHGLAHLSRGDWVSLAFGVTCAVLILTAPLIGVADVTGTILRELHP